MPLTATASSKSKAIFRLGLIATTPLLAATFGLLLNAAAPRIVAASDPQGAEPPQLIPLPIQTPPEPYTQRVEWLTSRGIPANPFVYPPAPEHTAPVIVESEPLPAPPPRITKPAPFRLTSILQRETQAARAVIDGRLYAVGDQLAPEWWILAIDTENRFVTVLRPDQEVMVLQLQNDHR